MGPQNRTFLVSMFAARLADQILLFLVPLVIFQITGSVSWSGIAFFVETLPRYVSFPVCGALCDRFSPLKLMRGSQTWRAVACVAGMAGYWMVGGVWWLIAISAVCGVLTTQGMMAREVILPQAFRDHRYEKVLSYTQIADQLGTVLGPLVAAGLLSLWPWEAIVVFAAGLFIVADVAVIRWEHAARPVLATPEAGRFVLFSPLATAAGHIMRLPGLLNVVLLAAALNLIIGVTLATSAAMVTGIHDRSEADYAFLQAAGAVATVAILFAIAHFTTKTRTLGVTAYLVVIAGAVMMGASPSYWLYFAGFVLVAGFDKMFNIYIRSVRRMIIPAADFGKTTGLIVMLNNLSQPLAGLLVGLFAGAMGAGGVILMLTAVMALVGAVIAVLTVRQIRTAQ